MTDDHPEREVPCPACGARSGSPCRRPSGHAVWGGESHRPRLEAAVAEGHVDAHVLMAPLRPDLLDSVHPDQGSLLGED